MSEDEWKNKFVTKFMNISGCTLKYAYLSANASYEQNQEEDPEDSACDEYSYCVADSEL